VLRPNLINYAMHCFTKNLTDTRRLCNPENSRVEYQQGILMGYEVHEYLLEKCGRKCGSMRRYTHRPLLSESTCELKSNENSSGEARS